MHALLLKLAAWLAQKLVIAGLIAILALGGYAFWLFLQEEGLLEQGRVQRLQTAIAEREQLLAAQEALTKRVTAARTELKAQKKRLEQAERVMASLRALESWWDRWFGNRGQQTANEEQMKKMDRLKGEASDKWTEVQRNVTRVLAEKDGVDQAVRRVNNEISRLETSRSRARHYAGLAWDKTKWWVILALVSYFLGPTLWALLMFYAWAPLLGRGRPIRLGPDPSALPEVGESHVSIESVLRPGERLRIKEKFLQASDEGIEKRTRFVLDWSIPFTSLACGLVELVELRNVRAEGEDHVTLSNGDDPHLELAQITVPAGSSVVVRPSFLAGVIQGAGERLQIRRHWRLFRWQSWVSGQFRFFEFIGPCRLVVSGSRGVRVETLANRVGVETLARRTNRDATIGFTPNLEYQPVRAETFWSYYRGMNPLFDDRFAGRGLFILQETAAEGPGAKAGRFWSSVWNGVLKVFGM